MINYQQKEREARGVFPGGRLQIQRWNPHQVRSKGGMNLMMSNTGSVKYLSVFSDMMKKYQESCRSSLDGYRFTPNETAMMIYMLKHPDTDTAKDIARELGISQSLICRSVDSLTKKGLIQVEKDPVDRRINHLTLNISDRALKKTLTTMDPEFERQMTDGVEQEELDIFQRVMFRMAQNVGAM